LQQLKTPQLHISATTTLLLRQLLPLLPDLAAGYTRQKSSNHPPVLLFLPPLLLLLLLTALLPPQMTSTGTLSSRVAPCRCQSMCHTCSTCIQLPPHPLGLLLPEGRLSSTCPPISAAAAAATTTAAAAAAADGVAVATNNIYRHLELPSDALLLPVLWQHSHRSEELQTKQTRTPCQY
jgi:hypothetical protein